VKLSEDEIRKLSLVNKSLGIAYGTGELPAMIASSRANRGADINQTRFDVISKAPGVDPAW
jgi:hypothetical protein